MKISNLLIALTLVTIAQTATFFQLQSQFLWKWAKEHPLFLSALGVPISFILLQFTKYCAAAFNGEVWPGRLIGFAIGAVIFAACSTLFHGESITWKTGICLLLAIAILIIQIA